MKIRRTVFPGLLLVVLLMAVAPAPAPAQTPDVVDAPDAVDVVDAPDVVDVPADVIAPDDAGADEDVTGPADDVSADDVSADNVSADDVGADDVGADDVGAECPSCPPCPALLEAAISGEPPPEATPGRSARTAGGPDTAGRCLEARLAPLAKAAAFAGATFGAVVARLDDGAVVFERNSATALHPASTAKLVTSAAALHFLGPSWRWETKVYSDAQRGATIDGSIYVKGAGDPTIDTRVLLEWAEGMRERGVRRVKGGVVADGEAFDGTQLPPGFDTKDTSASYRPSIAAFAVHRGRLRAAIYPGEAVGAPCRVDLGLDEGYLDLENTCTTVSGRVAKPTLSTAPAGRRTRVVVGGKMGTAAGRILSYRRIEDPLLQAAHAFRAALERVGIRVDGAARTGALPGGRRLRIVHESAPLATILLEMNKESDNFFAEMVLKTLGGKVDGWPATWEGAQRAVARYVATLKPGSGEGPLFDGAVLDPAAWTFRNGSGLYEVDRLPTALLARIVRAAALDVSSGPEFATSLPIAGRDGTLRRRARKTPAVDRARGKTGSLNGVDALAGIVEARDGARYVYAFLVNDARQSHGQVRAALDALLAAIAAGCPE